MKYITFPGLGLDLTINKIFVFFGSVSIHWYGFIIAVGFVLAAVWGCTHYKEFGIRQNYLIDMIYVLIPAGIIGARLYYVIFEFENIYYVPGDFWATVGKIVRIWDGGLAIYGGIIGGAIAVLIYCRIRKIPFLTVADITVMGLLIGQCIGRWGNFVNVEAFGSITTVPWRMAGQNVADYLMNTGQVNEATYQSILDGTLGVHPTFLYESLWNLLGFILIALILRHFRRFDGQMFLTYVAWYGLGRFWIESLRTDSLYIPGTELRISQVLALGTAVIALVILLYVLLVRKADPSGLYVNKTAAGNLSGPPSGQSGKASGEAEAVPEDVSAESTPPETGTGGEPADENDDERKRDDDGTDS